MRKSSERIVVFVTPAQKRAIANRAQGLGISVSELLRRAVLAFDATGEQVRAASIIDSMRAAQPDALNETLRRVAQALPAARRNAPPPGASAAQASPDEAARQPVPLAASVAQALAAHPPGAEGRINDPETRLNEEAVARVTARKSAADSRAGTAAKSEARADEAAAAKAPSRARARGARARMERGTDHDDTTLPDGAMPVNGRFA